MNVILEPKPLLKDVNLLLSQLKNFGNTPHVKTRRWISHILKYKTFNYLLTFICTFSTWIEAFPTVQETADIVSNTVIKQIIPQIGLPQAIQSDYDQIYLSDHSAGIFKFKYHLASIHAISYAIIRKRRKGSFLKTYLTKLTVKLHLPLASTPSSSFNLTQSISSGTQIS